MPDHLRSKQHAASSFGPQCFPIQARPLLLLLHAPERMGRTHVPNPSSALLAFRHARSLCPGTSTHHWLQNVDRIYVLAACKRLHF